MDTRNIPVNVNRIVKDKNLLLGLIEDEIGVSRGYFSRIKPNSTKAVSVKTLIRTAEVLDVTLEELLNDPPVMTNADKFKEVFGLTPNIISNVNECEWWNSPYN